MLYFTSMKITLSLVLETVHALALALWIGGEAALIVLVGCGAAVASHIFVVREQSVIEFAAIVMICIQYLTRHKFKKLKTLFVVNAVRNLLTFTALILAVYVMNSVKGTSIGVLESPTVAYVTAGGQLLLLAAVSAITLWLLAASARVAVSAVTPTPATVVAAPPSPKQPNTPVRSPRKSGNRK